MIGDFTMDNVQLTINNWQLTINNEQWTIQRLKSSTIKQYND